VEAPPIERKSKTPGLFCPDYLRRILQSSQQMKFCLCVQQLQATLINSVCARTCCSEMVFALSSLSCSFRLALQQPAPGNMQQRSWPRPSHARFQKVFELGPVGERLDSLLDETRAASFLDRSENENKIMCDSTVHIYI
jgi:hypothetical protein